MSRRLHSITGVVLFFYLLTHQLNHALGLISLTALDAGQDIFLALWRNPPATAILYGALLVHGGLALAAVYRRRRLVMPAWEAAQLLLGLAVPPLLTLHILGTRFAAEMLGVNDSYVYILLIYFVFQPILGAKQVLVTLVAWLHGCIGLHYWLRLPCPIFTPGQSWSRCWRCSVFSSPAARLPRGRRIQLGWSRRWPASARPMPTAWPSSPAWNRPFYSPWRPCWRGFFWPAWCACTWPVGAMS